MKKNRVLCLLLAVLMALSMAGCKGNSPGGETSHTGSSKKKPSKADIDSTSIRDPNTDRLDGSGGDGVNIEGDYDDSLDLLREMMGTEPSILFAAAFIGNSAGGPDDLASPCRNGSLRRILACAPSIRSFARSPVSGWWAAAAVCSASCPATPTPPLR